MKTITYQAAEREEETVSPFLMMVFEYGREIGLYGLLASRLKIAMKEVKYSLVNKAQTVIASLVMGCGHTKAINETLEPERAAIRLNIYCKVQERAAQTLIADIFRHFEQHYRIAW